MRTAEELRRLSALLDEALDLPATERSPWLDDLARRDDGLARTLREMLDRHAADAEAPVLDTGAASKLLAASGAAEVRGWHAGQAVGPYRLLAPIGQGGMGEVWLASHGDAGPDRRVALKLPVLDARHAVLLQRFARERDILASLAHPHIARLYDAGVTDDRQPYLALEYVEGVPITRYCEHHRLGTVGRVRLLLQVMQAVQHAHARLVIHRDLKPSNVLVTNDGRAMLLDFGIAKLLQGEHGEAAETELTRQGGRAMTVGYAAPEQLRGEPISTATDVWALGVLSYELLAGHRPFRGTRRGEIEERILDADLPRLTLSGTTTDGLRRSRLQEIETILGKAMKKRQEDRYGTVAAMADDLNRWLRDEPVLARPDSRWYRTSKLVVRHRGAVAASAAVLVAIIGAAGVALWQSQIAREQAQLARTEAATAQAVQDFLEGILRANRSDQRDPMAARDKTARQLLEEAAARIAQTLDDEPQAKLRLLGTLADMLEDVERRDLALRMLEQRAELIARLQGEGSRAHVQAVLATARRMLGQKRQTEAGVLLNQAVALQRQNPALDAETLATLALLQGVWAARSAAPAAAIPNLAAALSRARTAPPTLDSVMGTFTLASLQRRSGDADAANQTQRSALQALSQLDPARLTAYQRVRVDVARRAAGVGREDEAADQLANIDPVRNERDRVSLLVLSFQTPDSSRIVAAGHEAVYKRYLELGGGQDARLDEVIFQSRGMNLRLQLQAGRIGEVAQALDAWERSAEGMQRAALLARAELSTETGRFDEAQRAWETLSARTGQAGTTPRLLGTLAERQQAQAQLEQAFARADAPAARALFARLLPVRPSGFDIDIAAFEARLHLLEGKPEEAVAAARPAVETVRIRRPTKARIQLHQTLGEALVALGQPGEAVTVLETGLALVPSVYEPELSPRVALLHLALAEAKFAAGDRPGAGASLATGKAILTKHPLLGPQYLGPLARTEAKLAAR